MNILEKIFTLSKRGSNVRTEFFAGLTTFMTMAYIIFVQPAVLSQCGMDFGAVMVATCISASIATATMGLLANYPIALAPAMGENFFFAFTVILALKVPWETALGIVMLSGILFFILNLFRIREMIINQVPQSLKHSIAAGIGLFIAFIGLLNAGIIQKGGSVVELGDIHNPATLLSIFGLIIIAVLMIRKVKGAILLGMLSITVIGVAVGIVKWGGVVDRPPSIAPTLFKFDLLSVFTWNLIPIIIVFLFMDVFDTIGTLIGVSSQAGFLDKDGNLPRASRALNADAVGTVVGAALGTSTVTSYIESAAGVEEGGRTGLTSLFVALFFLLALFFGPLARMVGGGYPVSDGVFLYPITAPVLIVVGAMMLRNVNRIDWGDYTESLPAFLTIVGMPLTYSIADGLAFGFISYPVLKVLSGRWREVSLLTVILAVIFVARYVFLWPIK